MNCAYNYSIMNRQFILSRVLFQVFNPFIIIVDIIIITDYSS